MFMDVPIGWTMQEIECLSQDRQLWKDTWTKQMNLPLLREKIQWKLKCQQRRPLLPSSPTQQPPLMTGTIPPLPLKRLIKSPPKRTVHWYYAQRWTYKQKALVHNREHYMHHGWKMKTSAVFSSDSSELSISGHSTGLNATDITTDFIPNHHSLNNILHSNTRQSPLLRQLPTTPLHHSQQTTPPPTLPLLPIQLQPPPTPLHLPPTPPISPTTTTLPHQLQSPQSPPTPLTPTTTRTNQLKTQLAHRWRQKFRRHPHPQPKCNQQSPSPTQPIQTLPPPPQQQPPNRPQLPTPPTPTTTRTAQLRTKLQQQ